MKNKKRMVYKCPEGYVKNPLESYPRNEVCPCGSEKKFKKCCIDITKKYWVPVEKAKQYRDFMVKKGLRSK